MKFFSFLNTLKILGNSALQNTLQAPETMMAKMNHWLTSKMSIEKLQNINHHDEKMKIIEATVEIMIEWIVTDNDLDDDDDDRKYEDDGDERWWIACCFSYYNFYERKKGDINERPE